MQVWTTTKWREEAHDSDGLLIVREWHSPLGKLGANLREERRPRRVRRIAGCALGVRGALPRLPRVERAARRGVARECRLSDRRWRCARPAAEKSANMDLFRLYNIIQSQRKSGSKQLRYLSSCIDKLKTMFNMKTTITFLMQRCRIIIRYTVVPRHTRV